MAYTREQRAAKELEQSPKAEAKPDAAEVLMEKDGKQTEVRNNESVQIMQALGWTIKG